MAERPAANIEEKGHEPDKGDINAMVHDHHARIGAIEAHLGMAKEPGVAKEETGKREPNRERKRH